MERAEADLPQPGWKVRIQTGPFREFVGTVLAADPSRRKVRVQLMFFRQLITVEVAAAQVRRV